MIDYGCLPGIDREEVIIMTEYTLGAVESKFADIVWTNAPMTTAELVRKCEQELSWKRTTTYTVLKKLGEKGLFALKDGVVTVVVGRDEYYGMQSAKFVNSAFNGSLPAFLAAFAKGKTLTQKEIDEIRALIDKYPTEE